MSILNLLLKGQTMSNNIDTEYMDMLKEIEDNDIMLSLEEVLTTLNGTQFDDIVDLPNGNHNYTNKEREAILNAIGNAIVLSFYKNIQNPKG